MKNMNFSNHTKIGLGNTRKSIPTIALKKFRIGRVAFSSPLFIRNGALSYKVETLNEEWFDETN